MSWMVSRILLTILLFPSATLVLFLSFIFINELLGMRGDNALPGGALAASIYMVLYWLALWRGAIVWTPRRVALTWGCAAAAALIGIILGIVLAAMIRGDDWLGMFFGSLTAVVLWIIGTICIWRETVAERAARIRRAGFDTLVCPNCGYNLTGLSEARCPECGSRFTIDELLASQPERATSAAEVES